MSDTINHVAFICDGNGRWAKKQGRERTYGHQVGSDVVKDVALYMKHKYNVQVVSFYIFSTENWKRPKTEILFITNALKVQLKRWLPLFLEEGVQIKFIGTKKGLDNSLLKLMNKYETLTADCSEIVLNLCFNYGSRQEISEAVVNIINDGVKSHEVTEELISSYMYTSNQPEVDLMIRTSGEFRISNFYLWQLAYSELIFLDCYWPEVDSNILDNAINEYYSRNRRFGGIK